MAPNINNPGGVKNDPDEIRDGVVSDATRFPGGFIDQEITQAGAPITVAGKFQLSNSTFLQPFDVSPQDTGPTGVTFKPDGSRMFVCGERSDKVHQYSLSPAYDVSTATVSSSLDVNPQDRRPESIAFKPDGSRLYVAGDENNNIYQYNLSTDFDVSTASFVQSFDVSTQESVPSGVSFNADGSRMFVVGVGNDKVHQYSLSTIFDISTASIAKSLDVGPQDGAPTGLTFNPDGSRLYVAGTGNANMYQYRLSTDFDVSTASFNRSFDISTQDTRPRAITFNSDGSQMYVVGDDSKAILQYSVGTVVGELG